MPCRTSRDNVVPKADENRNPPISVGDRLLLLLGAHVDAHQRLRPLQRGGLGEVNDVDRRLLRVEEILDRLVHRRRRVVVVQRNRALGVGDQRRRPTGASGEVLPQKGDVAERGRHQQELGVRQLQQRHLPRPAAVGVTVEVELVHHHESDVRVGAFAQRDVGQHLRGAGDDRRPRVDRRIAGEHADVGRTEYPAEAEELFADQRLDRGGVVTTPSGCQRRVQRAGGHQRLTRAGRRRQHDVRAADQFDQRLLLRRVQHGAVRLGPGGEGREQLVGVGALRAQGGQVARIVEQGSIGGHREEQRALTTAAARGRSRH